MFRAFSRPSSGAQWLQWKPLVLPSYRGDSRAVFVFGPAGPNTKAARHEMSDVCYACHIRFVMFWKLCLKSLQYKNCSTLRDCVTPALRNDPKSEGSQAEWNYGLKSAVNCLYLKQHLVHLLYLSRYITFCYEFRRTSAPNSGSLIFNTLRTGSFKLFKRPFPGFLTILTL